MTKRAAIYARYSAGPRQTDLSIEGQEKTCKKYIKEKGYRFTAIYTDRHISGKTDRRPDFHRMIDDAKAGLFDVLVVYSLDRFSRNEYDTAIYKLELKKAGVSVESASENIPEGPEGLLMEKILEGLAVYYSAELSKKIDRGMTTKAEKGLPVGGHTPFGYALKNGEYRIDPPKAQALKQVFELYGSGATLAECSRALARSGFTTKTGKPFTSEMIKRMFSNKKYIGYYRYKDIEIEGAMPKIVDEDLFYMIQPKLKRGRKIKPKGEFALTGKLICGKCETFMSGTSGTSKTGETYHYYRCPGKDRKNVPRDQLEHLVARRVMEVFSDPQELDSLADKLFAYQQDQNAAQGEYELLRSQISDTDRKINNIVTHIAENGPGPELTKKLKDLEEVRENLKADLASLRPFELTRDQIRFALQKSLDLTIMSPQDLIKAFVHRVVLYDDRLLIEFNIGDGEGLKTSELLGFGQSSDWCTNRITGRTLTVYRGRVLLVCPQ